MDKSNRPAGPEDNNWNQIWERDLNQSFSKGPSTKTRVRLAIGLVEKYGQNGGSLLDIGCGNGLLLGRLALTGRFQKLAGLDIAGYPLESARQSCPACLFYLLDVQKDRLPETFDFITSLATIDIVKDDRSFLLNVNMMMKPKGYFILSVQARSKYWSRLDNLRAWRRYEAEELEAKCSAAGLKKVRAFYWGWPIYSLYYKILERVDDRMSQDKNKGLLGSFFGAVLYFLFFIDDLFIWTGKGRQLFAVFQKI